MTPEFKAKIRNLALRCGFALIENPDGTDDIPKEVYTLALELTKQQNLPPYAVILRSGRNIELLGTYLGKPTFTELSKTERLKSYSVRTLERLLTPEDKVVYPDGAIGSVHIDNYKSLQLIELQKRELDPV